MFEQSSGQQIGVVVDVEKYPAHDVYVVKMTADSQLLVPAVKEFVKEIDVVAKRLVVDSSKLADS